MPLRISAKNEARGNMERSRRWLCRQATPSCDKFDATDSITVCLFTTDAADAPYVRLQVAPTEQNGLHSISRLMVDKIVTIHKRKVGKRLGLLDRADVLRLDHRAIMVFLGLA